MAQNRAAVKAWVELTGLPYPVVKLMLYQMMLETPGCSDIPRRMLEAAVKHHDLPPEILRRTD